MVHSDRDRRFEVTADGHTGFLQYAIHGDRIRLIHTEVPPALGGRGLGAALAKAALDYARQARLTVIPSCPFVRKYLEKHPEYASLIHEPER